VYALLLLPTSLIDRPRAFGPPIEMLAGERSKPSKGVVGHEPKVLEEEDTSSTGDMQEKLGVLYIPLKDAGACCCAMWKGIEVKGIEGILCTSACRAAKMSEKKGVGIHKCATHANALHRLARFA
jgi:hypothetical protein